MVDLTPSDVARCEGHIASEEKGDGELAMARHLHGDGVAPANVGRRDAHPDALRIEPASHQLDTDAVADNGIIFAALAGHAGSDCGGRLLADPNVNQPTEFDDAEENRKQDERNRQHRLKGFLPTLSLPAGPNHDVWVNR